MQTAHLLRPIRLLRRLQSGFVRTFKNLICQSIFKKTLFLQSQPRVPRVPERQRPLLHLRRNLQLECSAGNQAGREPMEVRLQFIDGGKREKHSSYSCDCNLSWMVSMELVSNATWSPSTVCFTPERLSGVPLRHLRPGDLECASSDAELFRLWASWGVFLSAAAALLLLALWACCRLTSYGRSRRRTRRHLQRQYQQRQYSDISTLPSSSPAAAQQQQAPESSQGYLKTITKKKACNILIF